MLGWILSLLVTLGISGLGIAPAVVDAQQGQALTQRLHAAGFKHARVKLHVVGDPVFGLPLAGASRGLDLDVTGLELHGMPVSRVSGSLKQVPTQGRIDEAPLWLEATASLTPADLQAGVNQLVLELAKKPVSIALPFLGQVSPVLPQASLVLQEGRLGLAGDVTLRPGAKPQRVEVTFALAVSESRHQLKLAEPQASLNGNKLPSTLVAGFVGRIPPIDLDSLGLPEDLDYVLQEPKLGPAGLELAIKGFVPQTFVRKRSM